jgi:type IV pilus assembly protein PilM
MAHTIIGLDIGSYSVKVATVSASFRALQWTEFREYVIPHGERDRPERAADEALQKVAEEARELTPMTVTAISADRVMTRFVSLPFSDRKRIDSVLGFELEGQLPYGVDDFLYAYERLPSIEENHSTIFAAAVARQHLGAHLEKLLEFGLDPRVVTINAAAYLNLCRHMSPEGCVAIVDIGHHTTDTCIVLDGELVMTRSVGRAGLAVTQAIAERMDLPFEEAETLKHAEGRLPGRDSGENAPLVDAAVEALNPLLIALRQTMRAQYERTHHRVDKVILTGGCSRLVNMRHWLESSLNVPVQTFALSTLPFSKVNHPEHYLDGAAVSLGLALMPTREAQRTENLNFRRGQYGYEGDFKFLRDKMKTLIAMAAVLLIAGLSWAYVLNARLEKKLVHQRTLLSDFTGEHFDKASKNFKKTVERLKRPQQTQKGETGFPPMSAIAVLDTITQIQDEMNREAEAATAGGPADRRTPRANPIRDRMEDRRVRPRSQGANRIGNPMGGRTPLGVPSAPTGRPSTERGTGPTRSLDLKEELKSSRATADKNRGDDSAPDPDGTKEDSGPSAAAQAKKIELRTMNIDVFGSTNVVAETHPSNPEGQEDFRKRLNKIECFSDAKLHDQGTVNDDRHPGWRKFKVTFRIKCPTPKGSNGKDRKESDR